MGREIKRIALDFDWPLNKVWDGYLNPHYVQCEPCDGRGSGIRSKRFDTFMSNLAIAAGESTTRPDNYRNPPIILPSENPDDEMLWAILVGNYGLEVGVRKYNRIQSEDKLPYWPWPEHDPVETLLGAAGLPADWGGELEREIIYRLAKLTPPEHFYDCHHVAHNRKTGEYTLLKRKRVFCPSTPVQPDSDERILNYPHPNLGNLGICDVGTKLHELVRALGYEEGPFSSSLWRANYDMHCRVYEFLGMEPNEISEYGTQFYHWDSCDDCNGTGIPPANQEAYNSWEASEPPAGDGYQVWETISEGSPVTPVFATGEALIEHLVTVGDGRQRYSREASTRFVTGSGWAPSMIIKGGQSYIGIEACSKMAE